MSEEPQKETENGTEATEAKEPAAESSGTEATEAEGTGPAAGTEATEAGGGPEAETASETAPKAASEAVSEAATGTEPAAPESTESKATERAGTKEAEPASTPATPPAATVEAREEIAEAAPEADRGGVQVRKRHKSVYANEVKPGQSVEGIFLASRKSLPVDRNGKHFLAVTLADRTGRLDARLWDDAEAVAESFRESDHVRVRGQAQSFHGRLQIRLDAIEAVDAADLDVPTSEFVAASKHPVDRMFTDLLALVDGMKNAHLKALVRAFLDDPEHAARFKRAPAAQSIHHAWIGGLLEHTLSVMRLCERLCDHYPHVDRDLVLAGALFHDYGKIDELSYQDTLGYTDEGRLVGHLVMCCQWIAERAGEMDDFPKPLLDQLVHIVVSHHGQLEYGSPRRPQTLEALLVHSADVLDARVSSWTELLEGAGPDGWTDYVRVYDRQLYRGGSAIAAGAPAAARKKRKRRKKKKPAGQGAATASSGEARTGEARAPAAKAGPRRGGRAGEGGGRAGAGGRRAGEAGGRGRSERRGRGRADRPEGGRPQRDRPSRPEKPSLTFNPFAAALGGKSEEADEAPAPAPEEKAPAAAEPTGKNGSPEGKPPEERTASPESAAPGEPAPAKDGGEGES